MEIKKTCIYCHKEYGTETGHSCAASQSGNVKPEILPVVYHFCVLIPGVDGKTDKFQDGILNALESIVDQSGLNRLKDSVKKSLNAECDADDIKVISLSKIS